MVVPIVRGFGLVRSITITALHRIRADIPGLLSLESRAKNNHQPVGKFESSTQQSPDNHRIRLRIGICSESDSWINEMLPELIVDWLAIGHQINWAHDANILPEGDVCFYLSYGKIVGSPILGRHKNNLVVHESDLPQGRGWLPLTWQVLGGEKSIPVTLFEAAGVCG